MQSGFELLSFVLRSDNRLAALQSLSTEPQRRSTVQEATDIPRATLSRILADCRDRDLVERSGPVYSLTPLGDRLVEELEALFVAVDRLRALQTLADGLPLDELDVDLFEVEDLSVTLPNRIDPMAPINRASHVIEEAAVVRGFCYSLLHAPILAMTRDIVQSGGRFVGVVSAEVLEHVISDPELVEPVKALVGTGKAEVRLYHDQIGTQFILTEDRVLFLVDDAGTIVGLVETDEPALRPWAETRFEKLKRASEPLDPDTLGELLTA